MKYRQLLVTLIVTYAAPMALAKEAGPTCAHSDNAFHCVKYVSAYDGDTITVDIPGLHPMFGKSSKIRVKGIDTPEVRTKNSCEKQKARTARNLVRAELKRAKLISLTECEKGKYFRLVCKVTYDGKDLGGILVKNKLAVAYDGGRKPAGIDWCKD